MAIVVEKQKSKINWFSVIVFAVIVAVILAAAYYLFFAATPLIETIVPSRLKSAGEISKIDLNPQELFDNPVFRNLRQYANPLEPEPTFNPVPFLLQ